MSDKGKDFDEGEGTNPLRDGGKRTADGGPSLGEIFDCLTSSYRRMILYYLREQRVAEVDELVTQIARKDTGSPPEEVAADQRERIEIQVVHTHLPKLAGAGCIEYDSRSGTVRYREPPALLDKALELLNQLEGDTA